ncbi:MAG: modified peptide precursor CbpA [Candidatus Omnitrophota bacterium]|nr:modified peptide precursor CbpA [Candidatus Omnitrophota bacterium]
MEKKASKIKKSIIASRKKCKANGTGLSHYVLLNKGSKS